MQSSKYSQRFLCISCRRAFVTQSSSGRRLYNQNHSKSSRLNRSGRNVLITGGSRGIGLAIAEAFVKQGDKVCIIGRNRNSLQSVIDKWNEDTASYQDWQANPRHMFFVGDVGRRDTWGEIVTGLRNMNDTDPSWKAPDILVNAAGVSQSSLLIQTEPSGIEDVVQTNLMGTIWGCQSVGKLMVANQRRARKERDRNNQAHDEQADVEMPSPCIINISSLLALQNGRGSSVYAASKAGILGLTRALAAELGPAGIRVNAIVPGYIATSMTSSFDQAYKSKLIERIPLARFGSVDEIASAAAFLASNAYANNCVINLDGGLSAVSIIMLELSEKTANARYYTDMKSQSKPTYQAMVTEILLDLLDEI